MAENKRRVLVVDDSALICSLIKDAIRKHSDYDCVLLREPDRTIDVLHEYKPDLLVLDVGLPDMDGMEMIRRLREQKPWRIMPVILLAGKETTYTAQDAYDCGADDYVRKPFEPSELVLKIKSIFRRMNFTYHQASTALEKKTIRAMGRSVEVKDTYTEGHSARVALYSVVIAKALLMREEMISAIEDAAYLHDLGKIGIQEEILNKPGPLNVEEWEIMRTHPDKSAIIIESLGFLNEVVPMVKHHHERLDGSGYPYGLNGEQIPVGARIIAVADSFDAITSNRAFRMKRGVKEALDIIRDNAGKQFDAHIADIFLTEIKKLRGIESLVDYSSAESLALIKHLRG